MGIVKTLCYHKLYLKDDELCNGYDHIMKRVERGTQEWDPVLGEHLHEHLDYRANVLMREKVQSNNHNGTWSKVESKKTGRRPTEKESEQKERIIYCQEFNNNTCSFQDHHPGKFAGKTTTKFHICRRCHNAGEFRSHRDSDGSCPKRNQTA